MKMALILEFPEGTPPPPNEEAKNLALAFTSVVLEGVIKGKPVDLIEYTERGACKCGAEAWCPCLQHPVNECPGTPLNYEENGHAEEGRCDWCGKDA